MGLFGGVMTKIAVMVDSSSYLTAADLEKYHILMINDPIMKGETVYRENESWADNAAFYAFQRAADQPLTTSQPEPGAVVAGFDQLAAEGYSDVIFVGLSSGISGTMSTVQSIAESTANIRVHPWDSRIAAIGAGNQAKLAAKMALANRAVPDILDALDQLRQTTKVLFVVDEIKHLQRTGRISNGASFLGSLLNIKPMLTFTPAGKIIAIGKERQMKRAWSEIQKQLADVMAAVDYPIRFSVLDGDNPELKAQWVADLERLYPNAVVEESIIGPYIGVHTGYKAMGVIWARDFESFS
jgi:DegV family protein with EDD domain